MHTQRPVRRVLVGERAEPALHLGTAEEPRLLVLARTGHGQEVVDALRGLLRRVGVDGEVAGVARELAGLAHELLAHAAGQATEVAVEATGQVRDGTDRVDVGLDDAEPVARGSLGESLMPAGVRSEPAEHDLVPAAVGDERGDVRVSDVRPVLRSAHRTEVVGDLVAAGEPDQLARPGRQAQELARLDEHADELAVCPTTAVAVEGARAQRALAAEHRLPVPEPTRTLEERRLRVACGERVPGGDERVVTDAVVRDDGERGRAGSGGGHACSGRCGSRCDEA